MLGFLVLRIPLKRIYGTTTYTSDLGGDCFILIVTSEQCVVWIKCIINGYSLPLNQHVLYFDSVIPYTTWKTTLIKLACMQHLAFPQNMIHIKLGYQGVSAFIWVKKRSAHDIFFASEGILGSSSEINLDSCWPNIRTFSYEKPSPLLCDYTADKERTKKTLFVTH